MSGAIEQQDCAPVCGTLERCEALGPRGGLIRLQIRASDGTPIEVLADAASTLEQLASLFGSPEGAVGQRIELELDLFGFAALRSSASSERLEPVSADSRPGSPEPCPSLSDPGGRLES